MLILGANAQVRVDAVLVKIVNTVNTALKMVVLVEFVSNIKIICIYNFFSYLSPL